MKRIETWYQIHGGQQQESIGLVDTADFDWVAPLEAEWRTIRDEVETFMDRHPDRLTPYFDKRVTEEPQSWKTLSFRFWYLGDRNNQAKCPETMKILAKVPHVTSLGVSVLEPGADIFAHRGDTNATYRCHLPLSVPAGLPFCGFRVAGEARAWEEGKLLMFSDAAMHQAWNKTDRRRFVLLFDIMRPEFFYKEYRVCAFVLATMATISLTQKASIFRRAPESVKAAIRWAIAGSYWVILRLKNAGVA